MKTTHGTGKHTTIIPHSFLSLVVEDVPVCNQQSFFLECEFYYEDAIEGSDVEPPTNEFFQLTSMRTFCIVSFVGWDGVVVQINPDVQLCGVLTEDTYNVIMNKVLKELREENELLS